MPPFTRFSQLQHHNHCGLASLSACAYVLGYDIGQRALARAAGVPFRAFLNGVDEHQITKAADHSEMRTEFLTRKRKDDGKLFGTDLRTHLSSNLPAILLVDDGEHWVAVIGYLMKDHKYVVCDPIDTDHLFSFWSEGTLLSQAWNEDAEGGEYFAVRLSRQDRKPALWTATPDWIRLCQRGSEDTAMNMASDLREMVARASRGARGPDGGYLADVLDRQRSAVVGHVAHWAQADVDRRDLHVLYRDYVIVARAAGIRTRASTDEAVIAVQMAVLLADFAWTGEL